MMQISCFRKLFVWVLLFVVSCKKDPTDITPASRGVYNSSTCEWFGDNNIGYAMNSNGSWAIIKPGIEVVMGHMKESTLIPDFFLKSAAYVTFDSLALWNDFALNDHQQLIGKINFSSQLYVKDQRIRFSFESALNIQDFHFIHDTVWYIRGGGGSMGLSFKKVGENFQWRSFYSIVSDGFCRFDAFTKDEMNNFWLIDSVEKKLYFLPYGTDTLALSPVNSESFGFNSLEPILTSFGRIAMQVDDRQRLWIMSGGKIGLYDAATKKFIYNYHNSYYTAEDHQFTSLFWDKVNKRMWLLGDENSVSFFKDEQFFSQAVSDMVGTTEFISQRYFGMGVHPTGTCVFWGKSQVIVAKPG